jgi:large subunit ribosomal protein L20
MKVKRGNVAVKRRKKILKLAKGFTGSHSKLLRTANQQVMKSLSYAYIGRKHRKRSFRRLWVMRLNAIAKNNGSNYNNLMMGLKRENIGLNRFYREDFI